MNQCLYHDGGQPVCQALATHIAQGVGLAPRWSACEARGLRRPAEFCLDHASAVADQRNAAQRLAQEARLARLAAARAGTCAVCQGAITGTGQAVAGVTGVVCDACYAVAQSDVMHDPRSHGRGRKRTRTRAA
jgi:hypothetical protein